MKSASAAELRDGIAPAEIWGKLLNAIRSKNRNEIADLLNWLGQWSYIPEVSTSFEELNPEQKNVIIKFEGFDIFRDFISRTEETISRLLLKNAAQDIKPAMILRATNEVCENNSPPYNQVNWLVAEITLDQGPEMVITKHVCEMLMYIASDIRPKIMPLLRKLQKFKQEERDPIIEYNFYILHAAVHHKNTEVIKWLLTNAKPEKRPEIIQVILKEILKSDDIMSDHNDTINLLLDDRSALHQRRTVIQTLTDNIDINMKLMSLLLQKAGPKQKPGIIEDLFGKALMFAAISPNNIDICTYNIRELVKIAEPMQKQELIDRLFQGTLNEIHKGFRNNLKLTELLLNLTDQKQKLAMIKELFKGIIKHKEKCAGIGTMGLLLKIAGPKQKQEIIQSLPAMISEYIKQEKGIQAIRLLLEGISNPIEKQKIIRKLIPELNLSEGSDMEEFLQEKLRTLDRQLSMDQLFAREEEITSKLLSRTHMYSSSPPEVECVRVKGLPNKDITLISHKGKIWVTRLLYELGDNGNQRKISYGDNEDPSSDAERVSSGDEEKYAERSR